MPMLATEPLIGCSADKMLFYPADARSKSLAVKQKRPIDVGGNQRQHMWKAQKSKARWARPSEPQLMCRFYV